MSDLDFEDHTLDNIEEYVDHTEHTDEFIESSDTSVSPEIIKSFINMSSNQTNAELEFSKLSNCEHDQSRIEVLVKTMSEVIRSMKDLQTIINGLAK